MFMRWLAMGPSLAVQSRLMGRMNWSPLTSGLPTVALWILVVLANFSAFSRMVRLPSMMRGHQGASSTSTCLALSAYSSLIASRFFPVVQRSARRWATFWVAWCSGEGGGGVNDGLGVVVVLMAQAYGGSGAVEKTG